jgi:hypothetical protein
MSPEQSPDLSTTVKFFATAVVGALLGAVLGAAYLVTLPVKEISDVLDQYQPEVHYVLKGRTAGGDAWKYKATELQDGRGEVTFLENELNRWAASFKTEYPEEKPAIYVEPQKPIFRLEGDKLLVSTKADGAFGSWKRNITLSLEGEFEPNEAILQIRPEKLYIGSLRVPGPLKDFVWKEISSVYTLDEEFESLWSTVASANIYESQLILTAK